MKWFLLIGVVVLVGVCLPAGTSVAATYTISHPHSQGVDYANISFNGGSSTVSAYLGRFIMETKPLTGELPPQYPIYTIPGLGDPSHSHNGFFSYCLEPLQSIGLSHTTYYEYSITSLVTDGISVSEAALIRELFGRYSPILKNDPTGPYTGGTFRTAASALQLAIWKIGLDGSSETLGSWDFASGSMRVSSANVPLEPGASLKADAVALLMLNSLTGSGPMASGLEGLQNDSKQDLIIQAVPEPLTMVSAFLMIGGLGAYIRRRTGRAVA